MPSRALGAGRCVGAPYADARPDGTHTDWAAPQALPAGPDNLTGVTYVLPHVDPSGTIYTTLTNFTPKKGFCCASVLVDKSTDGGKTWSVAGTAVSSVTPPPGDLPEHAPRCDWPPTAMQPMKDMRCGQHRSLAEHPAAADDRGSGPTCRRGRRCRCSSGSPR